MSIKTPAVLAIAALLLASPSLLPAQSAAAQPGQNAPSASEASDAIAEAAKMVPATAVFVSTVDSQKMTSGTQIKVQLKEKVRLGNGTELPAGTILVGQAVDDATQSGKAKLALRFTQANLKSGQIVSIKVTIFSIHKEAGETESAEASAGGSWDKQALGVNQADAIPSIDLHSKIASPDSGVFVSTKKDDVKLSQGFRIGLAIAPRSGSGQHSENGY
jgi:hypothetical protein